LKTENKVNLHPCIEHGDGKGKAAKGLKYI